MPAFLNAQQSAKPDSSSASSNAFLSKTISNSPVQKTISVPLKKLSVLKDSTNKKKIFFTGEVQLQSQYINNSYSLPSANGFYSTIGFSGKLTAFKMPLTLGLNLTFHNEQFRADFTSFNVGFDPNGFKDGLKNNYLSYIKSLTNYFGNEVGEELKHFEDSLKNYDKYKNILSSPNYYKQLNSYTKELQALKDTALKATKDSLHSGKDSTSTIDSTALAAKKRLEYLNDTINKLKKIAQEYENLENYRKQNLDLVKMLDKYHTDVDKIKNTENILSLPGIEDKLKKAGMWDKKTSALAGIQKFNIGKVPLNLSRYTIQGQSIYGFNVDYLYKKALYAGIGLGFAAPYNFSVTPNTLLTGVNPLGKFNFHRLAGYIRLGYGGLNENHIHLIWTGYGDRLTSVANDTILPIVAPANSVLSVEAQQKINSFLKFNAEIATSNSSFFHRAASVDPINIRSPFNYAAMAAIKGNLTKLGLSFGLKGEAISTGFGTSGNVFLRSGVASYTADIKKSFLKNKVTLSSAFSQNFQGYDGRSQSMEFITSTSSATVRAAAFATYVLSYTLFKQLPYMNNTGVSGALNHNISLQQQYTSKIKKTKLLTTIGSIYGSNKVSASAGLPAQSTLNLQASLTQDMFFTHGIQWHLGAGLTYITGLSPTGPDTVSVPTTSNHPLGYWTEMGNTIAIKKALTLSYQVRYTRDGINPDNIRASANATVTLYRGLRLTLRGTYTNTVGTPNTQLNIATTPNTNINVTAGLSYAFTTLKAKKPIAVTPAPATK